MGQTSTMAHTADRATAATRDAYRQAHSLMLINHKRRRDEREDIRGKAIVPRCSLTGDVVAPVHIAVQGDALDEHRAHKPVLRKTIFSEVEPCSFGSVWLDASRPHLRHVVDLLKDLFTHVDSALPTITCVLSLDHEVSPRHNRGKCAVSELETPLETSKWVVFVRQLRVDHAYQAVVSGLARMFGMQLTFHTVNLVPFETYTWRWPWQLSIQAQSNGASVPTMTFVPLALCEQTSQP